MVKPVERRPAAEERDGYTWRADVPYEVGPDLGHRAKIGLIVLANDYTIEYELSRMLAIDGVALYATRIPMDNLVTMDTLRAMEPAIARAAELILPGDRLDALGYGCTSGTIAIGKARLTELVGAVRPGVAFTTPILAGIAAMQALGLRRVALLTPYVEDVTLAMRGFIREHGIEVPYAGTFNIPYDDQVRRVSYPSLRQAAIEFGRQDVDGVFVSCTSMHVADAIAGCETELGKPVIASNQALAWHLLRLSGVNDRIPGHGRLMNI